MCVDKSCANKGLIFFLKFVWEGNDGQMDCLLFKLDLHFGQWQMSLFFSPVSILLIFIFYFSASCMKQKYKHETFYLKHFFKSPLTFLFSFLWIFLINGREDHNFFFTKPSGVFMKHNWLLPDLKGYFRNKGKAEMRDLWNLLWSFSKGISRS